MMNENDINIAIQRCLTGTKDGDIVLKWLARSIEDNSPLTVVGENGTDPIYAAYRDGGQSAYRDLLDRAGYRITYERKPDERDSDGPDRDDPTGSINPDDGTDNGTDGLLA